MTVQDIITEIENFAPIAYQEDYDNCGLITGQKNQPVTGALLSLDCTEEVIEEALKNNCNLIITHHPILFAGIKKINGTKIKYAEVSTISLHREHQNKGFGTQLYKTLLKYLPDDIAGIGSNLQYRINKKEIPKIYQKLGYESYNDGDFQLIKKNTL